MSEDWVQVGAGDDPPSSFATKSLCIAGYPSYIAGSWVDFSNHFDPVSGNEHGHLAAEVRLTNSDADAKSQLDLLRRAVAPTTNTSDCVLQSYMSTVAIAAGQANVLPGARILAVDDAPAGLTGQIIHASVPYRFQGAISVYYFDDIRIQQGRVVARLLFSVCCHAFDFATVEKPVIDAVSRRMAASAATAA